jgi:hypothetical protein
MDVCSFHKPIAKHAAVPGPAFCGGYIHTFRFHSELLD